MSDWLEFEDDEWQDADGEATDWRDGDVDCGLCHEAPAQTADGLCTGCSWGICEEIKQGLRDLEDYLHDWAVFRDWEDLHERRQAA